MTTILLMSFELVPSPHTTQPSMVFLSFLFYDEKPLSFPFFRPGFAIVQDFNIHGLDLRLPIVKSCVE
jgi:hypothetical protein